DDPRDDPRGGGRPLALRRGVRRRALRRDLPRLPPDGPRLADGLLRGGDEALSRHRRARIRRHGPRRDPLGARPRDPVRAALDLGRPQAGCIGETMLGIPLKYNWRNLFVRKITTSLTVVGIGLVVAVFLSVM